MRAGSSSDVFTGSKQQIHCSCSSFLVQILLPGNQLQTRPNSSMFQTAWPFQRKTNSQAHLSFTQAHSSSPYRLLGTPNTCAQAKRQATGEHAIPLYGAAGR